MRPHRASKVIEMSKKEKEEEMDKEDKDQFWVNHIRITQTNS